MVKLTIQNNINEDIRNLDPIDKTVYGLVCELRDYDKEKWKDGKTYEFETLKELQYFVDSCDIDFTDESKNSFRCCDWYEVFKELSIDTKFKDDAMKFTLGIIREYRD